MPKSDITQLHPEKECERIIQKFTDNFKKNSKKSKSTGTQFHVYVSKITINNYNTPHENGENE